MYHPITQTIQELLKQNEFWFETFEHEPVRTSEEAAKVRAGYTIEQGAKAIIVRVKRSNTDKQFVMLVLPGDKRFDNGKIKTLFHAKDIRFASPEEISSLTNGIQPGGVPPFGNLFSLLVFIDPSLLLQSKIVFNAGDRRFSIAMNTKDYITIVSPKITQLI